MPVALPSDVVDPNWSIGPPVRLFKSPSKKTFNEDFRPVYSNAVDTRNPKEESTGPSSSFNFTSSSVSCPTHFQDYQHHSRPSRPTTRVHGAFEPTFFWTPITSASESTSASHLKPLGYFSCSFCKARVTEPNLTSDAVLTYHHGIQHHLQSCEKIGAAQTPMLKLWETGKDLAGGGRRKRETLEAWETQNSEPSESQANETTTRFRQPIASALFPPRPRPRPDLKSSWSEALHPSTAFNSKQQLFRTIQAPPYGPQPSPYETISEDDDVNYDYDSGKDPWRRRNAEELSSITYSKKNDKLAAAATAKAVKDAAKKEKLERRQADEEAEEGMEFSGVFIIFSIYFCWD